MDWPGINCFGVDVSHVVLKNTRRFVQDGVEFRHLNAGLDPLPDANLPIAKQLLQHWSNQDVPEFSPRLTGFHYALITIGFATSGDHRTNTDIQAEMW